jgi:hypothetical protein
MTRRSQHQPFWALGPEIDIENDDLINRVQRVIGMNGEGGVGDQVQHHCTHPIREAVSGKARGFTPGMAASLV